MSVTVVSPERKQSNKILRSWCAEITGDVLSIGSGGDIDKQGSTYREYFSRASSYITSDIDPGLRTDLVLDATGMPSVDNESYDCVFCSGVLEHVRNYPDAISEVSRVLRTDGVFLVGVPFGQPIHRAPFDFWRFTEFGLRYALRDFDVAEIVPLGDPKFPYGYWAKARKL